PGGNGSPKRSVRLGFSLRARKSVGRGDSASANHCFWFCWAKMPGTTVPPIARITHTTLSLVRLMVLGLEVSCTSTYCGACFKSISGTDLGHSILCAVSRLLRFDIAYSSNCPMVTQIVNLASNLEIA